MFGKFNIFKSKSVKNEDQDMMDQIDQNDEYDPDAFDEDSEYNSSEYDDDYLADDSEFEEDDDDEEEDLIPAKTYYTSKKMLSMKHRIDITDENDEVVYYAKSKVISLRNETTVFRADSSTMARITKKPISVHEVHFVEMDNGNSFELSTDLARFHDDIIHINALGWDLEGSIVETNYEIWSDEGDLIAAIEQKLISLHDKYSIEIFHAEYEEEVIAVLIALQHIIHDREKARDISNIFGLDD